MKVNIKKNSGERDRLIFVLIVRISNCCAVRLYQCQVFATATEPETAVQFI